MNNFYVSLAVLIFFTFNVGIAGASSVDVIPIVSEDAWVIEKKYDIPDDIPSEIVENGVYYLLKDDQIFTSTEPQNNKFYRHLVELIINPKGLEESSQINVKFDPDYQSLYFHKVQIIRNDKVINKLNSVKINILNREKELENLIYNGKLTANIILDDVRVGDVVEYSYSIKGENPIYDGVFSYHSYVEWSIPLHYQYFRLLWNKPSPLHVKKLHTNLSVQESVTGNAKEYVIEVYDAPIKVLNSEIPRWHYPYGSVMFSEFGIWSEVANWAFPLYESAQSNPGSVSEIIRELKTKHADTEGQIAGALQYVQSEIRYLGIEAGVNSHRPSAVGETLSRRYGDCKDKTVLLIAILKGLNVEAYPALVNTQMTKRVNQLPPNADAFDHVITLIKHDGESYWFDPTREYQPGKIDEIYQPAYGYALVVDKQTEALTAIEVGSVKSGLIVHDDFNLSSGIEGSVKFDSTSNYSGYKADNKRNQIIVSGLENLSNRFFDFYKYYYSGVEIVKKMEVLSDDNSGTLSLYETYVVDEFWVDEEGDGKFNAYFYASSISTEILRPEQLNRNSPYRMSHPNNVSQKIEIQLDSSGWQFDNEEVIESNDFFYFSYNAEFFEEDRKLVLNYKYETKVDHVNPEYLDQYLEARDRVLDLASYSIFKNTTHGSVMDELDDEWDAKQIIFILFVLAYCCSLIYAIVSWRLEMRRNYQSEGQVFFPVSIVKLSIFSVVTFGLYSTYWFYRNWKYVKDSERTAIMPIARAIFSCFWFYPLYKKLVDSSSGKLQKNILPVRWIAMLMAVCFFILESVANIDYIGIPSMILAPLLLIPLANYINHIAEGDDSGYGVNSKWRVRHYLLTVFFVPVIFAIYGSEIHLLSSSSVVDGKYLWRHDLKFMERRKIIEPGEKIILFYSDAFLDIREDGNGFTDNRVFSYWKEDGTFFTKVAKFSDVKDIKHNYAESWSNNTSLTIILDDESEFILYASTEDGKDKLFIRELRDRWARARAENGDSDLQYDLSLSTRAVSSKTGKVKIINDWLIRAAESGDARAQFQMGLSLLSGIDGRNEKYKALELLLASASKGHAKAELMLGELYSKGILVEQDLNEAIQWYENAHGHNSKSATTYLAWHLATIKNDGIRDGDRAILLMKKSIEDKKTATKLSVLAAAYAESGLYKLSVKTQESAIALFGKNVEKVEQDFLESYKSELPWRETWSEEQQSRIEHIPLFKAVPEYPYHALNNSIEGWSLMEYDIKPDGSVENIKLIDASVDDVFHAVSVSATNKFVYFPRMIDGKAVTARGVRNRFVFNMEK